MTKLLPFVNKPLEEIEVIGNERTGQLHLVSLQGVTPNENPADFQEQQKKQQKFLLRLTQRIKQLARDEGIPVADMRKRVMAAMTPEVKSDDEVEVVEDDKNEIFDYLDEQTADLLFGLQEDKAKLAIRAATFMLKYRVVYPVISLSNSVAGSKAIHIQSPQTPIEKNTSIRFGPHNYAETTELLVPGLNQTDTLHVDELPFEIKDGDVGFICQPGSRNLNIGFSDWTEQDTRDEIPEELIGMLFEFYQKEAGIVADLDETEDNSDDESEGNLLTPSQTQLEQSPSTGVTSSIDSSTSESETPDSTPKTLEASPVG